MKTILRTLAVLAILGWLLAWSAPASACPNCKEAIAAEDTGDPDNPAQAGISDLGRAYSISVLFMLGAFLSVLVGFGSAFYWLHRTAQRAPGHGAAMTGAVAAAERTADREQMATV
jgi:hypothetical protein